MIKFERTAVLNMDNAIRGARNPMNSWDRSDSYFLHDGTFCLGPNDLGLAQRLIKSGSDHRKFIRQIFVSVDITAPLYWWKEYDTYKVATTANSTSTMHKIHSKPITLDDFSTDHLDEEGLKTFKEFVDMIEAKRLKYMELRDQDFTTAKAQWYNIIQMLPESYNQMRTCTLDYETLRNIAHSRKGHKLDEWSKGFIQWMHTLPYAEDLIFYEN